MLSETFYLTLINDMIPEPRKEYDIIIEDIAIANGKQGNINIIAEEVPIVLYDNDCESLHMTVLA